MRKRVINGVALRTIRELKAKDDTSFRGGTFGPTCGMSHVHLINIEKGRRFPREEVVLHIAAKLGVPVDAISHTIETAEEAIA
jgi:DNA-binding XRE family transcriptional regulator